MPRDLGDSAPRCSANLNQHTTDDTRSGSAGCVLARSKSDAGVSKVPPVKVSLAERPTTPTKVSALPALSPKSPKASQGSKPQLAAAPAAFVEDAQTALARMMQEEISAKKALVAAMSGDDVEELSAAVEKVRALGVDNKLLVKAEASLKQLKFVHMRREVAQRNSTSSALKASLPEIKWEKVNRLPSKAGDSSLLRTKVSPEGEARLAGLRDALDFKDDLEAWTVPTSSTDQKPAMVRNRCRRASSPAGLMPCNAR